MYCLRMLIFAGMYPRRTTPTFVDGDDLDNSTVLDFQIY